jgi:hypothetical protein
MTTLTQRMNVVEENLQSIRLTLDTLLQNLLNPALMVPGTLRFGGNAMQLDHSGVQIATGGSSTVPALVFVDSLYPNPTGGDIPYGALFGYAGVTGNTAQISLIPTDSNGNYWAVDVTVNATTGNHQILMGALDAPTFKVGYADGSKFSVADNGSFRLAGVLSPAQISANQNDYAPTGIENAISLRLNSDASRDITGIATDPDSGRILLVQNVGAQNIVLKNESASSSAAYRLALKADITIAANGAAILWYDTTSVRWRCFGTY